jgi:hypothetical protein
VAGLLEANDIMDVKLLANRVRPDMIQKNDMMSVKDVQVGGAGGGRDRSAAQRLSPSGPGGTRRPA